MVAFSVCINNSTHLLLERITRACHSESTSGHLAVRRALAGITERFKSFGKVVKDYRLTRGGKL